MNRIKIRSLLFLSLAVALMASCKVTQTYHKPTVETKGLFRNVSNADTSSIAQLHWKEMFTDTLLQRLISEGINHNLDLQSAYSRVRESEAYYQQSRQQLLPSLDGNVSAGYQGSTNPAAYANLHIVISINQGFLQAGKLISGASSKAPKKRRWPLYYSLALTPGLFKLLLFPASLQDILPCRHLMSNLP